MRKKMATIALAGTLGLTAGALLVPTAASAQTAEGGVGNRLSVLKEALTGLVTDGTLTQPQADRVAATLDAQLPERRHGGRGPKGGGMLRLSQETVADALGVTVEDLRAAREAGQSLAQVAEDEGLSRDEAVDRLVAAAEEQLAAAVTAGRLTQEQADARAEGLEERVSLEADRVPGSRDRRFPERPAPAAEASPSA